MLLPAPCKINLTLDLVCTLPDGYHAIDTVMQTVSLCDFVTVEKNDTPGIVLTCSDPTVPTDAKNTAYRAAELFLRHANIADGIKIYIDKHIPHEAGLGGGSADAAAVFKALDSMYPGVLSNAEILSFCLKVGADVSFCFVGGTALCRNKGEVIAPLTPFSSYIVIAKPDEGVSTAAAFRRFDSAENLSHPDITSFVFYAQRDEYKKAFLSASNIFEQLTDVKTGSAIKDTLIKNGAYYASMSGSGSAYFGLFDTPEQAENAKNELKTLVSFVEIAKCE